MSMKKLVLCAAGAAMFGLAGAAVDPPAGSTSPTAPAPKKAEVGKAAPDFTLQDVNGKTYKLSDFKGKNVVLQWINPGCPVCNRVASTGLIADMRAQLKTIDKDFVHLAINSTKNSTAKISADYFKKNKLQAVPTLDDSDGTVGKLYGAKTTPHMFVIDAKGILRYQGALDDDPVGRSAKKTNYVVSTFKQITAGETVSPAQTKSYGCSVKYKR